jgi:hypothetical protein
MNMHVDLQRIDTGPGGPDRLLVRAHGRAVADDDGPGLVLRIGGRSYAVVPVDDPAPERDPDEGELVSAALVVPESVLEALRALDDPHAARRGRRDRRPAPSAADLAQLARAMEDEGR